MSASHRNLLLSLAVSVFLHGMLFALLDRVARPFVSGGVHGRLAAPAPALQVGTRGSEPEPVAETRAEMEKPPPEAAPPADRRGREKVAASRAVEAEPEPAASPPPAPEASAAAVAPAPAPALSRAAYYAGINTYYAGLAQTMARLRQRANFSPPTRTGGRSSVRIFVGEGGVPQRLELLGSSGDQVLDDTALALIRLSVGHTPVPEDMRSIDFTIDLAINFPATMPPVEEQ